MKDHKYIAIIYGILLTIGLLFCICSIIFIPIDTYSANNNSASILLNPSDITIQDEDTTEFHFRDVDWDKNGNCLYFISSHQEIKVEADDVIIFERNAVQTLWGHSPGFAREYIEIPYHTKEVTVTVTACYPIIRNASIEFYQGFSMKMFQELLHQNSFVLIVSIMNICMGLILLIYGIAMSKRSSIGSAMIYLSIFTILLGIWAISDNGLTAFFMEQRAACSFISFASLSMVGIPFTMFVHRYLEPEDKYIHKIILAINIINIILVYTLMLLGIRDMKQSVILTHIGMLSACLYLPFSLIHMFRKHLLTRRFWVTVCSLVAMCPPLAYSMYMYYYGSHNVDGYGNVLIFVFIAIFAVDVSRSIMKDIDAGKKAAIYQELAVTDLLTGCYNRNAYRNDTSNWTDLHDVLLLTCDLNNLKQCNDTLGHAYGDQYITDSAAMLKKIFSEYGKVYRIGGDEFCIIIPNSHKCNIEVLLAALTEEERIYNDTSEVINLQIAFGYADFNAQTDSTMEDIRIRADERMYQHKKELKNGKKLQLVQ